MKKCISLALTQGTGLVSQTEGKYMDAACLQYRLTEEERTTFNETGLLQIENVLSAGQIAALTEEADRIFEAKIAAGHDPTKALFYPNFIPDSPLFQDLVDYEKVLPQSLGHPWLEYLPLSCSPYRDASKRPAPGRQNLRLAPG